MTARELFENTLTELSKVNAPSLGLREFNIYINKAIALYINRRYNIYDINLQTTDDLSVLKSESELIPTKVINSRKPNEAIYEVSLPLDYLHILNCRCEYHIVKLWLCYNKDTYWETGATRLTSDTYSKILNDYYNRPTPENPYFYIHNKNSQNSYPTNPRIINEDDLIISKGTDMDGLYNVTDNNSNEGSNFTRFFKLGDNQDVKISTVDKETAYRYGNIEPIRMEIRYGTDDRIFKLVSVKIDYIKAPQYIRLTPDQMDTMEDYSLIMEYPEYVCQEIINELTHLLMERTGDQRLASHVQVTLSIANPAQALTQPTLAQA